MHKSIPTLFLALLLLTRAGADAAPPTLAQALATAPAPRAGLVLSVGADKTPLPKGATLPPGTIPADCATAFGLAAQPFGTVTALGPATMTLLNDQPGDPDLSSDVNPYQVFQELAASLSDDQWKALTSEGGLGLDDLSDDTQRALFWAQFPHKTLKIVPSKPDGRPHDPAAATDMSDSLGQVHLRLGQTAALYPPSRAGNGHLFQTISSDPDGTNPRWEVFRGQSLPQVERYGIAVRMDVPNAPKPGDLSLDGIALRMPIPVAGLKTIGDLVSRVGRATGLELYADRHYEDRTLTMLGPTRNAPASDLLRALAFCVTGTFRRVGSAYVLTDDLTGVGATHQIWSEFQDRVTALRSKSEEEAQNTLSSRRSIIGLPTFGDPLAATKQQETSDPDSPFGYFLPQVPRLDEDFPFAALTPSQQDAARRIAMRYAAINAAEISKDPSQAPDLNGKWLVVPHYTLQALLPGFPQPIEIRSASLSVLAFPPDDVMLPLMKQMDAWDKAQVAKKKPTKPAPSLTSLLALTAHRAVLADPRSPAEVRALVATMRKLGLNQLWLYVFEDGLARIPGTPLPQPSDAKDDLLDAALAATKGTGITVFPTTDLLTWGQSPPPAVRDVNVLGETSVEIDARRRAQSYQDPDDTNPPVRMSVNPLAPDVESNLSALVKTIAARPGIGGMVWRATDPMGYDNASGNAGSLNDQIGYTLPTRLAFLRRSHADPLDIAVEDHSRLDFHLPSWDDKATEEKLRGEWSAFRADADLSLLRALFATAQDAAPTRPLPLIVNTRRIEEGIGDWYGTWDDVRAAPPTYHGGAETGDYEPGSETTAVTQARSESKLALVTVRVPTGSDAGDLATLLDRRLNGEKGKTWGGFVLDIATGDGGPGVPGLENWAAQIGR